MGEQPPDFREILDWVEGRLGASRAARVESAIASDARVRRTAAWMHSFIATTATHPMRPPPASVRTNLNREFAAWNAARMRAGSDHGAGRAPAPVAASLVFDSRTDLVDAQVRSGDVSGRAPTPGDPGGPADPWSPAGSVDEMVHLAFTSTAVDLVLDLATTGPDRLLVDGQVLPLDDAFAGIVDVVLEGAGRSWRETCDAVGRFTLEDVDATAEVIRVVCAGGEVVARLDLG